jgi:pimeloyl-ACP methyl ester carboxylesterase
MSTSRSGSRRSARRRLLLLGGLLAACAAARLAYRRLSGAGGDAAEDDGRSLGWGEGVVRPEHVVVTTPDGAELAVWDLAGEHADAPVVVLPHCWGCSHEIWLPVSRRLRAQGYRVVLYDQRGHGLSTRGSAPLAVETLAHDLETVLVATDVRDIVLAGHSMGGMSVMSLATYRPEVLHERAKATVLVATSATSLRTGGGNPELSSALFASPFVTRALQTKNGHLLVRSVFGTRPLRAHMELTRDIFAACDGSVRGDYAASMAVMDLLEGISGMQVPTTVMVGTRDTLTVPRKADQMASTIPGARLVRLKGRGHMLPLEDPDAVTDEIVRAAKG